MQGDAEIGAPQSINWRRRRGRPGCAGQAGIRSWRWWLFSPSSRFSPPWRRPMPRRASSGTRKFSFGRRCGRFERRSISFTPIWKACLPTREAGPKAARTDILSRFRCLIDGIEKGGENGERKRKRYLRSLPVNPFATPGAPLDAQWTFVSSQSEAPVVATSSYGTTLAEAQTIKKDIYDLHPKTSAVAIDGTRYADW